MPPSTAERLARLAARLTNRDRRILELLAEHRVLTVHHLAALAFPSLDTARHRLAVLHRLELVERFRPRRQLGSAPYHYVLGPAGAHVLAAQQGEDPTRVRYRRADALAVAYWPTLDHLLAVNGFFCALARAAHDRPGAALVAWWSERRCAKRWGELIRPDGYGRWRDPAPGAHYAQEVDFFVEVDRATEPPARIAAKLTGYTALAEATGIATPLLVWLPTPAREAAVRAALGTPPLLVATANAALHPDPAGPAWLPLGSTAPRQPLVALAALAQRQP